MKSRAGGDPVCRMRGWGPSGRIMPVRTEKGL